MRRLSARARWTRRRRPALSFLLLEESAGDTCAPRGDDLRAISSGEAKSRSAGGDPAASVVGISDQLEGRASAVGIGDQLEG